MMTYKGYAAHIEFDDDAEIFHGEVVGIRDVVTFQGKSVDDLHQEFHASVDDYLEMCRERGEEPDRPFSGNFSLRLTPEQHRRATLAAKREHKSLNAWVAEVIDRICA